MYSPLIPSTETTFFSLATKLGSWSDNKDALFNFASKTGIFKSSRSMYPAFKVILVSISPTFTIFRFLYRSEPLNKESLMLTLPSWLMTTISLKYPPVPFASTDKPYALFFSTSITEVSFLSTIVKFSFSIKVIRESKLSVYLP